MDGAPAFIRDIPHLEDLLSDPPDRVVRSMERLAGDIVVLGAAGKMGPSLARMARRASDAAGISRRVIAVSRFSSPGSQESLQTHGIETVRADLLDPDQLAGLPEAPNVVYMAGMKFGSTGSESLTWALNSFLPGQVAKRYHLSRIVVFSTGNVYGLSPVSGGGGVETDAPNPAGEYAMSCLGRERIFEHFSRTLGIPVTILRLNYAVEMRYGVLLDLARRVALSGTIELGMGHVNVIWQADASAIALESLEHAAAPPTILNVTGPETLSVRRVCQQLAGMMGVETRFEGSEAGSALLSSAQEAHRLFGYPQVGAQHLIRWTADWVRRGGATFDKPTHFESRDGRF